MATGVIGALTLLISACSALTQTDIKRVLAYSTISQIGYMFLALGVGAWDAAIFHLVTHAFFKALLFMSAGAVILRLHHEQDMFRMGGVRHSMPGIFATFVIGSASLAALPLVTAGFYSKEAILQASWVSGYGGRALWCAGIVGAFLTALYIFRAVFIVFFGDERTHAHGSTGWRIAIPLTVLSVLALVGGFMQMPAAFAHVTLLSDLLGGVFGPASAEAASPAPMIVASLAPIAGIALAWWLYGRAATRPQQALDTQAARFFKSGWELDRVYERAITAPLFWLVRVNRDDFIDGFFNGIANTARRGHDALSLTQTGRVRWYAGWVAVGSVAAVTIAVLS
jgi:NADH-quinone oxidoreductase subunit L